jgi:ribosomal protein L37AE/L43A
MKCPECGSGLVQARDGLAVWVCKNKRCLYARKWKP